MSTPSNNPTLTTHELSLTLITRELAKLQTVDNKPWVEILADTIFPTVDAYNSVFASVGRFFGSPMDGELRVTRQRVGGTWQPRLRVTKGLGGSNIRSVEQRVAMELFQSSLGADRDAITSGTAAFLVDMFNDQLKGLNEARFNTVMSAILTRGGRSIVHPETRETIIHGGLLDGTGNRPIPNYGANTFSSTHSHFRHVNTSTSAWTTPTGATSRTTTLRGLVNLIKEHGYTRNLVIIGNPMGALMQGLRELPSFTPFLGLSFAGASEPAALAGGLPNPTVQLAKAVGDPTLDFTAVGTFDSSAVVIECPFWPQNYLFCFAYSGPDSTDNPVLWRQTGLEVLNDNPTVFFTDMTMYAGHGAAAGNYVNGAVLFGEAGATDYVNPTIPTLASIIPEPLGGENKEV
jgi:hypothetical protein